MIRHSIPHFLPNSGGIACLVAEINAALNLVEVKRRAKLEWGSNPQPVGFTVTPRAAAPRPASILQIKNSNSIRSQNYKKCKVWLTYSQSIMHRPVFSL